MIRRIQQFTTRSIPISIIEGLEPTRPAPEMNPNRGPMREGGRPPFRGAPGRGAPGGGYRGANPGYGAPRHDGPRMDSRFDGPRGGDAPRFDNDRGAPRSAPRFDNDRGAPRSGFGAGRPAMRPRSNGPR
jgi:hypothetical protein